MIGMFERFKPFALCAAVVLSSVNWQPGLAEASCVGAYREFKEGQREIAKERREMRKAVRNADSRREARKEIREGMREMAREKIEQRHEIRGELRPWC